MCADLLFISASAGGGGTEPGRTGSGIGLSQGGGGRLGNAMFRNMAEAARTAVAPAAKGVADEAAKAGVKATTEQLTKAAPSAATATAPSSAWEAAVGKGAMAMDALRSLLANKPAGAVAQPAGRATMVPETARGAAQADGAPAAMDLDVLARLQPIQPHAAGVAQTAARSSVSRPTTASGAAQGDRAATDLDAPPWMLQPIQPHATGTAQPAGGHTSDFMRRLASTDVGPAPSNDDLFPPQWPRDRQSAPGSGRAAWRDSWEVRAHPGSLQLNSHHHCCSPVLVGASSRRHRRLHLRVQQRRRPNHGRDAAVRRHLHCLYARKGHSLPPPRHHSG